MNGNITLTPVIRSVTHDYNKFTYYLKGGIRRVVEGFGDSIDVAKQHGIGGTFIEGVRFGDDHAYRWNDVRQIWENMLVEFN